QASNVASTVRTLSTLKSPMNGTTSSPAPQLDSTSIASPDDSARTRVALTNCVAAGGSLRVVTTSRALDGYDASFAPKSSSTLMTRVTTPSHPNSSALAAPYFSIVP